MTTEENAVYARYFVAANPMDPEYAVKLKASHEVAMTAVKQYRKELEKKRKEQAR